MDVYGDAASSASSTGWLSAIIRSSARGCDGLLSLCLAGALTLDGADNLYINEGILPGRIVGHRVVKVTGIAVPR